MALFALIISIITLIISIVVALSTIKNHKKQNIVNGQQKEINDLILANHLEQSESNKKAEIHVSIINKKLRIRNIGKNTAKNLNIIILDDNDGYFIIEDDIFPLNLASENQLEILVSLGLGSPYKFRLQATWDDSFSKNRSEIIEFMR